MEIVYRPGKQHLNVDALSRMPVREGCHHYQGKEILSDLPCGGCKYCTRTHSQWHAFFQDIGDVILLAGTATTMNQNPRIASVQRQAHWLDLCSQKNLQNEQATDQVVAPLYNWLRNGISPAQGEIALLPVPQNFCGLTGKCL